MAVLGERRGYQDLIARQKAMDLAEHVYGLTASWPREERCGLIDQLRRSAVSAAANIAEGQGRAGPKEFAQFLSIAHGSLCGAETYIVLAWRVRLIDDDVGRSTMERASEVGRLI